MAELACSGSFLMRAEVAGFVVSSCCESFLIKAVQLPYDFESCSRKLGLEPVSLALQ